MRVIHLVAALAVFGSAGAAGAGQPFGAEDLVRLARISEVAASPDGKRVAYTLRTTDMEANKGRTSIWVLEIRRPNAAPVRISDPAAQANAAEWSADGRYLYYLTDRSGSTQVWRSAVGGAPAEALQVTQLPLDVGSFRVSPKSDRLLITLEIYLDCADLACTQERLAAAKARPGHGILYEKMFVRHWDQWSDGRRSQLFSIALDGSGRASGTPQNLTGGLEGDVPSKPFGGREDYAISADGATVAFSLRRGDAGEPWSTNFDIYTVSAGGAGPRNMSADNAAFDGRPAFSPRGSMLAYVAADRPGDESDRLHLMLLDVRTGAKRPLTGKWDRSISSFEWSKDGKTLFATTDHLGQHPLWAIDADTGRAAAITGDGDVEDFSVGPKKVLFALSSLAKPADLYAVGFGGGKPAALTHLNEAALARRELGQYEQFSFAGAREDKVYGYIVKPAGFKADAKYPLALVVHGGPEGSLANQWHWRWNAQAFAGAGYGVVLIDFHGSTGYGAAFTDSINGDWGGKPLEDLKLGLAAALKGNPWLDGARACALGGSYGGYMMNWIAGRWPDRFKCLISHDGIFDNRSMYYSTEELWFPEWENGGPEYQNPKGYSLHNPIDLVAEWKTPTLVIHGERDYRVPYEQGLAVFTALQRRGVPSELLFFPDENHWVLKPANSLQWYDTVIAWMNRWTRP